MTDLDKLLEDYQEAKKEVLSVYKSIKWAIAFELDGDVMDDLQERYKIAVEDFQSVCDQLEDEGVHLSKLILMEMGVVLWNS